MTIGTVTHRLLTSPVGWGHRGGDTYREGVYSSVNTYVTPVGFEPTLEG